METDVQFNITKKLFETLLIFIKNMSASNSFLHGKKPIKYKTIILDMTLPLLYIVYYESNNKIII